MSLFGNIVSKIVSYAEGAAGLSPANASPANTSAAPATASPSTAPTAAASPTSETATDASGTPVGAATPGAAPSGAAGSPLQSVDIGAVLLARAASKGETLHWQTSIVDLLKVLDLDSSLDSRKQLAAELGVHAGADGSAEENIALHKAVVAKLEENGGQVPADMKG